VLHLVKLILALSAVVVCLNGKRTKINVSQNHFQNVINGG